ncbi:MAG: Uma2 family endonuclease [Bacteroidota bacterium]
MLTATSTGRLAFTVDDLHKLYETGIIDDDIRVELLNGELYPMSPINYPHAHCVNVLTNFFTRNSSEDYWIVVQNPIYLNQKSLPEPDVAIYLQKDIQNRDYHPTADIAQLVIEVADSTYKKDREKKLPLYAEGGVIEVWIVNLTERRVEVYTQPSDNQYTKSVIYDEDQTLPSSFDLPLEVKTLFLSEESLRM